MVVYCYDKILVTVAAYVNPGYVFVMYSWPHYYIVF